MSILVREPSYRRPMSGLGAYAQLLPRIQQAGFGALLDAEVCDFDVLLERVRANLALRAEYQRNEVALVNDAAVIAHSIYEHNCPNATYVNVESYYYGRDGWDRHHHRREHAHARAHQEAASRITSHAAVARMAPLPTHPSAMRPAHTTPTAAGYRAPAMHHAGRAPSAAGHAAPAVHRAGSRSHGMRGLGSVVGAGMSPTIMASHGPVTLRSDQIAQIQDRVAATVSPSLSTTTGTLDPCVDPTTGADIPCDRMSASQAAQCARCSGAAAPSTAAIPGGNFSIEGALPGGVALLLGAALGLVGISVLVGK